ncbi:DUF4129 domain-containing protein [Halogeometricum borinquense]|uniref:DUF4129 domain-containing protein n=1 Tax=Halogeometricum borinquense TaxID=60847 RepID=A0A6C0UMR2_9EURY|nr:DUF4129 domain-containing protein [Halogeometricum borinquense]
MGSERECARCFTIRFAYSSTVTLKGGAASVAIGLIAFCLVVAPVGGVAGVSTGGLAPAPASSVSQVATPTDAPTTSNNSTIQHANPDSASGSGDLSTIREWLSGRISETLIDCTEQTRVAERVACSRLDESYPEWASKYATVVQESGESGDSEETLAEFNKTRTQQRSYIEAVNDFRETKSKYERARESGNTSKARSLARDLVADAVAVNRTGGQLQGQYQQLTDRTSLDLDEGSQTIEAVVENTTETSEQIRELEFVETTLQISANRTTASFGSPTRLDGRLTTNESKAVANRAISVLVGEQRLRAQTDSEGRFDLVYRPTLLSLDSDRVRVAYQPARTSLYGRSETTVGLSVRQTNASVTVSRSDGTARYGEIVRFTGRVSAAGRDVANVPVRVSLGKRSRTVTTTANGTFSVPLPIPASLAVGTQTANAAVALTDRAISSAQNRTTVQIRSTETNLSLSATNVTNSAAQISGQLTTDSGQPVSSQQIQIRVGGTTVKTLSTDARGMIQSTIGLEEANGSVTVTAAYEPNGGNLEPSTDAVELTVPSGGHTGTGTPWWNEPTGFIAIVGLLAVLGTSGIVAAEALELLPTRILDLLSRKRDQKQSVSSEIAAAETEEITTTATEDATESDAVDAELAAVVEPQLARGATDEAVIATYETIRTKMTDSLGVEKSLTHWELLEQVRAEASEDVSAIFTELTSAYEQAAYAPEPVQRDRASEMLEVAQQVVDQTDQF